MPVADWGGVTVVQDMLGKRAERVRVSETPLSKTVSLRSV